MAVFDDPAIAWRCCGKTPPPFVFRPALITAAVKKNWEQN
jgi:hypothetical protein